MNNNNNTYEGHLEPRVAKLETGLELLTENVNTLQQVVREQGASIERQIHDLTVAVTQASGPKKTDWSVIISALLLVMAVGSAIFWPLNQTTTNNKHDIQGIVEKFDVHQKLSLHPVGMALVERIEEQLQTHIIDNNNDMKQHQDYDSKQFDLLDKKLQTEYSLINSKIESQITALDTKINLELQLFNQNFSDKINRVNTIMDRQDSMDLIELRQWRNKAMKLE